MLKIIREKIENKSCITERQKNCKLYALELIDNAKENIFIKNAEDLRKTLLNGATDFYNYSKSKFSLTNEIDIINRIGNKNKLDEYYKDLHKMRRKYNWFKLQSDYLFKAWIMIYRIYLYDILDINTVIENC